MKHITTRCFCLLLAMCLAVSLFGCAAMAVEVPDALTSGDYRFTIEDGQATIVQYTGSDQELVMPDQLNGVPVVAIGDWAFQECASLTSVKIPEGVEAIRDYAFLWCEGLMSVDIPQSVTSLGDGVFWGCGNLRAVAIPEGVTGISDYMFYGCGSLSEVTLPESVTGIGRDVFQDCPPLALVAKAGSFAAQYAEGNGIRVIDADGGGEAALWAGEESTSEPAIDLYSAPPYTKNGYNLRDASIHLSDKSASSTKISQLELDALQEYIDSAPSRFTPYSWLVKFDVHNETAIKILDDLVGLLITPSSNRYTNSVERDRYNRYIDYNRFYFDALSLLKKAQQNGDITTGEYTFALFSGDQLMATWTLTVTDALSRAGVSPTTTKQPTQPIQTSIGLSGDVLSVTGISIQPEQYKPGDIVRVTLDVKYFLQSADSADITVFMNDKHQDSYINTASDVDRKTRIANGAGEACFEFSVEVRDYDIYCDIYLENLALSKNPQINDWYFCATDKLLVIPRASTP